MAEINTDKQKNSVGGLTSRDVIKLMQALEGRSLSFDQLYYYAVEKLSPTRLVLAGAQSTPDRQSVVPRLLFVRPNGDTIYARSFPQYKVPFNFIAFYQLVADADPMEVGASIGNLAAYADRYERDLFEVDRY